jgi:hypothetical protein
MASAIRAPVTIRSVARSVSSTGGRVGEAAEFADLVPGPVFWRAPPHFPGPENHRQLG